MNKGMLDMAMKRKGLTLIGLAERVYISYAALRQKVIGKIRWNIDDILLVARALDLSMEEVNEIFFDGELKARDRRCRKSH